MSGPPAGRAHRRAGASPASPDPRRGHRGDVRDGLPRHVDAGRRRAGRHQRRADLPVLRNKDDLLVAVIVDILEDFRDQVPAAIADGGADPVDRFRAAFAICCRVVDAKRHAVNLTYRESRTLSREGLERIQQLEQETAEPIVAGVRGRCRSRGLRRRRRAPGGAEPAADVARLGAEALEPRAASSVSRSTSTSSSGCCSTACAPEREAETDIAPTDYSVTESSASTLKLLLQGFRSCTAVVGSPVGPATEVFGVHSDFAE